MVMKSSKVVSLVLVTCFVMLVLYDVTAEAAAPERPMQRRRRPFLAEVDADGISLAPSSPRFFSPQRRANGKTNQATSSGINNKSLQSDIAESCKSEPGCEWNCQEKANECICRCQFNLLDSNIRAPGAREARSTH